MSYKTKIIIFVVAVILLVPLVVTVVLKQRGMDFITSYVESKTGRALTIEGDFGVKWILSPIIYAEQVKFANSSWAQTPFAFTADKLTVSLSFVDLFRGQLKVTDVELDTPQLWIEQHPETRVFNLDLRSPQKVANKTAKRSRLLPDWMTIETFTIRQGEIFYSHKYRDWEFSIEQAKVESMGVNQPTRIEALGEAEQTAISFSGELGDLESLLHFQEAPVKLSGYVGKPANQVAISGVIGNLFRWYGLNLLVEANVTNLADLSNLFGFWLLPYKNISAQAALIQPKRVGTMRLESLSATSSEYGLQAYAEGGIGRLIAFNDVDIKFNATGHLDRAVVSPSISEQAKLETSIAGSVFGDRKSLTFNIEQAEIVTDGISVTAAGSVSNALKDWSNPLPLEMKIESPDALARLFDVPKELPEGVSFPDTQAINVVANLNRQASQFDLRDINITSAVESLNLNATGKINDLGVDQIGEIKFVAEANEALLNQIYQSKLLALIDELSLVGAVAIKGSSVNMPKVKVRGKGDGVQLSGTGSVGNLLKFKGLQMDVQLGISSLSKLESLTHQPLPETGSLDITGVLQQDSEGKFSLNKITGALVDDNLTVDIDGQILALGGNTNLSKAGLSKAGQPNISLNIGLRLDSIEPIDDMYPAMPFSGLLSQLVPLSGSAQLSSHFGEGKSDSYSLTKINLATLADEFSGQISGRLDNLFAEPLSPSSDLHGRLAQTLSGKLSLALSGNADYESMIDVAIPVLNPAMLSGDFAGAMDIVFSEGQVGLENVDFNINSEQAMLNARGAFSRLSPLQADKFELEFDAESLATIVRNTDLPLVWENPVKGLISVKNSHNTQNILLDIKIAENDLAGEIDFIHSKADDTADAKRSYLAKLVSKNFDLTTLLAEDGESDKIFSKKPLNLAWLMDVQAEIDFSAEHFKSSVFILDDFKSTLLVNKAHLVTKLSGQSSKGAISVNIALVEKHQSEQKQAEQKQSGQKQSGQKFNTHLEVIGKDVDFSTLTKLEKDGDAGIYSVAINLDGIGGSIAEIAGNATGSILLEFSEAKIKNGSIQIVGGDLFLGLLDAINPLAKQDEYLDIECGVIHFNVRNGVAQTKSGLALKTDVVTLLGGGEVRLGDEELTLVIRPKARKGLGINVNSIAKMIQVGGTINNPQIETSSRGFIESGIAVGAVIISGGLSLILQGLYDKTRANADVCRIAVDDGLKSVGGQDNVENGDK